MTASVAEPTSFSVDRLRWQVTRDAWMRGGVIVAALVVLIAASLIEGVSSWWLLLAMVAGMGGYFAMLSISAQATVALAKATVAIEVDPSRAEAVLREAIGRRPLVKSIRLLLYHRLALLRHRQGRFAEAAAICDGVLTLPLGKARPVRPSLLLLTAEARLNVHDLPRAWAALRELYRHDVSLVEALQRLLLRTRYEVTAGYDDHALRRLDSRLQLAELMPARQCAAMHALLALAARRHGHAASPALRSKAELLCEPGVYAAMERFDAAAITAPVAPGAPGPGPGPGGVGLS